MEERLSEVVEGTAIALRASGINRVLFVYSKGTEDLSLRFSREAEKFKLPLTSVMVGTRYPQRNIRELEQALQRFEKHEGVELGGLCFLGVATLAAICDAVAYNKPVMERYVAVGGMALKNPLVIRVRIGTRIGDVFEECGGFSSEPVKIAVGSPLRGKRVLDLDEPITKTTTAIFALSAEQIGGIDTVDCINCGECRAVCPVGLDPERLFKLALSKKDAEASREGALECHGCGCCEILCPSRLPLSSVIRDSAIRGKQLTLSDSGGSL
jgi:electron transport complex protein RnfC